MRFDSTVSPTALGYAPSLSSEERDVTYARNFTRKNRRLQRVFLKGVLIIYDPDTREIFDAPMFEDSDRLLKIGEVVSPGKARFFVDYN
jgi:hypothetical protein